MNKENNLNSFSEKLDNNLLTVVVNVINEIKDTDDYIKFTNHDDKLFIDRLMVECITRAYHEGSQYTMKLMLDHMQEISENKSNND